MSPPMETAADGGAGGATPTDADGGFGGAGGATAVAGGGGAAEGLATGGVGADPCTVGAWVVSSFGWVIPAPGLARSVMRTVSFFKGTVEVFAVGFGGLGGCGASSLIV